MENTVTSSIRVVETEKTQEIIAQDTIIKMTARDFQTLVTTLESPPVYNIHLQQALVAAYGVKHAPF